MSLLVIIAALASSLVSYCEGRNSVSFDFGWRHRTGLHDWAKPNDPAPIDTNPGEIPAESRITYDDSNWLDIQLPHDALIGTKPGYQNSTACPDGCSGNSFYPRHVLWYRKSFKLPSDWEGDSAWLEFQGSFRETTVWINGEKVAYHDSGYLPFRVRLDNVSSIKYGDEDTNEIAVFVDPDNGDEGARSHGSGWWYEGGGLYRNVYLHRASKLHVESDGLFAYSNITWSSSNDTIAESATIHVSASVTNQGDSAASNSTVIFVISDDTDNIVAQSDPIALSSVDVGSSSTASVSLKISSPKLWESASPNLYTVTARVLTLSSTVVDTVNVSHGIRSLRYDANQGFYLNEKHYKVRGFCDHNQFAVVGMAVSARIKLFRAQALRALGGNGRRFSHNPPDPIMLDIYDNVGVVVMDENRLFDNNTKYVSNMGALVKRDRNHPSITIWSFCNEAGCEGNREAGGPSFREITYELDGSRPVLANMFTFDDLLSHTIDVQGFSHQSREKLEACHAKLPNKPIFLSECCSCNTMRDEDEGRETVYDNPHYPDIQKSFNARCTESNSSTNSSDGVEWGVGTYVWTLHDYFGEPPVGGFEVSSTYGQYDLCGFPKAASFWYRTQWLLTKPDSDAAKPFPTKNLHEVHLVESWESPDSFPSTYGNRTRSIHVYSSTRLVELFVNGESQGQRTITTMSEGPGSYAEFLNVTWKPGNLTAVAIDSSGNIVARDTRMTNGKATSIFLSLDAPSKLTGTGEALLADGQDAALLRASVLDESGEVMHLASNNITFKVVSGPGRVQGTHNGDPHLHASNVSPSSPAYHGLVRAVIRVTETSGRDPVERDLLSRIDVRGPMVYQASYDNDVKSIVVEASSRGLKSAQITIPISNDPSNGVIEVARAYAGKVVDFFGKN